MQTFKSLKSNNSFLPFAERICGGGALGGHEVLGLLDQDHEHAFGLPVAPGGLAPLGVRGGRGHELEGNDDVTAIVQLRLVARRLGLKFRFA